ncbi:MAG: hypothetical protein ACREI3_11945 [Nitrospirales bacterium]
MWRWLIVMVLLIPAQSGDVNAGDQGDGSARLDHLAELPTRRPPTTWFYDEQGKVHGVKTTAVMKSMEAVCREINQDGTFIAYKRSSDRILNRRWKEVDCKEGRLVGLWKEYFYDKDMETVLYYDATGQAVKQALYINGRLTQEREFTRPKR